MVFNFTDTVPHDEPRTADYWVDGLQQWLNYFQKKKEKEAKKEQKKEEKKEDKKEDKKLKEKPTPPAQTLQGWVTQGIPMISLFAVDEKRR